MTSSSSSVPYVAWFDRNDEEKYASIADRKSKPETDTAGGDLVMPHEPESPTPIYPDHDAVCRALDPILHPSLGSRFVSLLKWFFTSPLLFAMIYALLTLYLNSIIQIFTERRVPDLPVLPDLGHDILPRIEYWEICDYYAGTFAAATVLRILMLPKMRITILRRYLFFQGTLLFLRSFTIVMTSLPVPLPVCSNTATGNIFVEALLIMVLVHRTCADILFSGHTVNMMLMALMWTQYTNGEEFNCCIAPDRRHHEFHPWLYSKKSLDGDYRGWNIVKWFIWLVAITGCLIIIAARFHYTDDVAIAIFLTVLIWKFYHYYIKNVHTRDKTLLNRWLIWFEGIDADLLLVLSTQMEATKQAIIDQRHRQQEIERERARREQEQQERKREEQEEKKKQSQDTSSSPSHPRRLVVNVAHDTIINIPSEPIKATSTRSSLPIVQRSNSSTQLPIARFTPDTHVELSPSPVVKLNRESSQINQNIKSS